MMRVNPGLKTVTLRAAVIALCALAIGLPGASGCSNVIGLSKDYYEEEDDGGEPACIDALEAVGTNDGFFCPDSQGMVRVPGGYCIDKTEVTWAAYDEFLTSPPAVSYTGCDENDSLEPTNRPYGGDLPVTYVDWCDAATYCHSVGKRLCGALGGGASRTLNDPANSCSKDEWFTACSSGGQFDITEGDVVSRRCNVNTTQPNAVGKTTDCSCGDFRYQLLKDMNGNVAEWVNQCDFLSSGAPQKCLVRGGSFDTTFNIEADCYDYKPQNWFATNAWIGFRCCADLVK